MLNWAYGQPPQPISAGGGGKDGSAHLRGEGSPRLSAAHNPLSHLPYNPQLTDNALSAWQHANPCIWNTRLLDRQCYASEVALEFVLSILDNFAPTLHGRTYLCDARQSLTWPSVTSLG